MHERQRLGAAGEALAATYLATAGMTVLHRNWRASIGDVRGELDLVVADGDVLVMVEVRTRTSPTWGTAAESVDGRKRRRLRRLAGAYLHVNPHPGRVRGDVVAIDAPVAVGHHSTVVRHLRGAW